ncbi:INO80 complex subunit D-like [Watersipora subatra]|uniref:INO80 complex subunit D-like n=1 Tax=Watersipora subatra TaxID=2589382 RepID=UPI00355C4D65
MYEGRNVHFTTNNKPLCSFSGKLCNLRRLHGFAFCVRHILEDSSAPFKQCVFVVKASGQRCTSAIPSSKDREYCNAHMQVMGIIPKKERKKKPESSLLPDSHGFLQLDSLKPPNGYHSDEQSNNHRFSASKMFPELAEKLSLDNQKNCDLTSDETASNSIGKTASKSSGVINSLSAKRVRRPTRKYASMQKRKQLGLLTEEEGKSSLTVHGYKAYDEYARDKMANSILLTPVIDSSDDDSPSLSLSSLLPCSLGAPCSPLSHTSDLSDTLSDSDSNSDSLLKLKRACIQLSRAKHLNQEVADHTKHFTNYFLDTIRGDLDCASLVVQHIRARKTPSRVVTNHTESRSFVKGSVTDSVSHCTHIDEVDKPCHRRPIPMTNLCSRHLLNSSQQKLFLSCTYSSCGKLTDESKTCGLPALDTGQGAPLCQSHLPKIPDPFVLEQEMNLKKKKKKSKPFASRRSKKRKKMSKLQKPMSATDAGSAALSSSSEVSTSNPADAPKSSSSPMRVEDDDLDSDTDNILSPLDKSLLPLGNDESKILDDNEIDEVLNEEDLNLFPESVKNEVGMGLTDAEADLIFSQNSDELLNNLKGELPDDITDAILHVEYEAEMEKQKQQQLSHTQTIPQAAAQHQQHPPPPHRLMQQPVNAYDVGGSMDGYTDDYGSVHQSYGQGPPPDYPGATKFMPNHLNVHANLNYMHEQGNRYTHHQIHPKVPTSLNNAPMLHRQSSYHLPPSSPLSLSASSTQLNSNSMSINRMGRLPPVSTITMQQWPGSESTPYQNGFHSPTEQHHMYQHNGLPSPPHYQPPREHRLMYSTQLYNNGAYSLNRSLRPPHPQCVNMPMQQ